MRVPRAVVKGVTRVVTIRLLPSEYEALLRLVTAGYYPNISDAIRDAIRQLIERVKAGKPISAMPREEAWQLLSGLGNNYDALITCKACGHALMRVSADAPTLKALTWFLNNAKPQCPVCGSTNHALKLVRRGRKINNEEGKAVTIGVTKA